MKKQFNLLVLLLLVITSSLDAQELVPRFYWATMYDTLDITKASMDEMRQSVDSIDFTTVSDEDFKYLESHFEPFQKRWMLVYGTIPKGSDPSAPIFVGGMDCEKCELEVSEVIKSIEGVSGISSIDRNNNLIQFFYNSGESQDVIEKVLSSLEEQLFGCGYVFHEYNLKDTEEVNEELNNLAIIKAATGKDDCDKHPK